MTIFSHRPYFVCLLPVSAVNVILCNMYDPFLAENPVFQNKTLINDTFFSQFVLCHASNSTSLLLEILGGRMHRRGWLSGGCRCLRCGRSLVRPASSRHVGTLGKSFALNCLYDGCGALWLPCG